jgi:hypothetical protein
MVSLLVQCLTVAREGPMAVTASSYYCGKIRTDKKKKDI